MRKTVLFVDDEPNLLHALARALRRQSYEIYTARSAEEGMEIIKSHPVDLVVSDESMPGMLGTEFLAWVAEHFPDVVRIVLTGQASLPSTLRAINEAGVHRFLTKPCNDVDLAITINDALEDQSALE